MFIWFFWLLNMRHSFNVIWGFVLSQKMWQKVSKYFWCIKCKWIEYSFANIVENFKTIEKVIILEPNIVKMKVICRAFYNFLTIILINHLFYIPSEISYLKLKNTIKLKIVVQRFLSFYRLFILNNSFYNQAHTSCLSYTYIH